MIYLCDDDHDQIAHSGDCPLCRLRSETYERINDLEDLAHDLEVELRDARIEIETLTAKLES